MDNAEKTKAAGDSGLSKNIPQHPTTVAQPKQEGKGELLADFATARGLSPEALLAAGYGVISLREAKALGFTPWADYCVQIPYPDVEDLGRPFSRIRQIGVTGKGKYLSARGTGLHAYLAPGVDWKTVFLDPQQPLIKTEGEIKALVGCSAHSAGFPLAIGFSGVSCWDGRAIDKPLVAELYGCVYKGRLVYIAFDADKEDNPDVQRETTRLAARMSALGANVWILHLNKTKLWTKGNKLDLEDYITRGGEWSELLSTAELHTGSGDELGKALGEYAYRKDKQQYIRLVDGVTMGKQGLEADTSNRFSGEKPLARKLLASPKLLRLEGVTVEPASPSLITPSGYYNRWAGFVTTPRQNAEHIDIWVKFVHGYFEGKDADTRRDGEMLEKTYHQFLAYLFQNPGKRMSFSIIHQGHTEGTGKSIMIETPARIIGTNESKHQGARILGPDELYADYPTWADGTVYVAVNEPSSDHTKHEAIMKALRTNESLTVNNKYGLKYQVPNMVNFQLSTNATFTHRMSVDSRRDIVWTPKWTLKDAEWMAFAKQVGALAQSADFRAAILYHALTLDIADFDPNMPAPLTEARKRMAANSSSTLELEIQELWEEIEAIRDLDNKDSPYHLGIFFTTAAMEYSLKIPRVGATVAKLRLRTIAEAAGYIVWSAMYKHQKEHVRVWGYGNVKWEELSAEDKKNVLFKAVGI